MILLSIKSAIYYMICLLLSTLGIVEFEKAWSPSGATLETREKQLENFASLQMPHRSINELQINEFFDHEREPILKISERNSFRESVLRKPSASCNYLVVIEEVTFEKKEQREEANNEYVFLISR